MLCVFGCCIAGWEKCTEVLDFIRDEKISPNMQVFNVHVNIKRFLDEMGLFTF